MPASSNGVGAEIAKQTGSLLRTVVKWVGIVILALVFIWFFAMGGMFYVGSRIMHDAIEHSSLTIEQSVDIG
jgi:hypothetical protein